MSATAISNHGSASHAKASTLPKSKTSITTQLPAPPPNSTIKSKKEPSKASNTPANDFIAPEKTQTQDQMMKVSRRASKPIINWFQRKLAGTVRARRVSDAQRYGASSPRGKEKQHRRSSVPAPPQLSIQSRTRSNAGSRQARPHSHRGTISLNESNDGVDSRSFRSASDDGLPLSAARESLYSPASYLEADEDASVRPLPPSSPPSPSPSRDSSSYLSQSRTFRSMTASTKPTTVLSVDLHGGMAHIAQAPPTPTTPAHRIPPHIRTHSSGPSAGSITFSSIQPQSPSSPSRPSSGSSSVAGTRGATLTAPLYTTHHPRNNPRPSSPPPDDASVLTLASSAFGMPGARIGAAALAMSGRASFADDSVSQWSNAAGLTDSTSHFGMGENDGMGELEEGLEEERYNDDHDVDASVRALRPRSSRRGSWDSTASGWSANMGSNNAGAPSPGVRAKWASGSFRTGGFSTVEDGSDDDGGNDDDLGEAQDDIAGEPTVSVGRLGQLAAAELSADGTKHGVQTPPAPAAAVLASTMTLPGSKKEVPTAMASTVVLPGSKAVSEAPSPEPASEQEGKSGASTPTKTDAEVASAELNAQVDALKLEVKGGEQGEDLKIQVEEAPFSAGSTVPSEYQSAPSSPAPVQR